MDARIAVWVEHAEVADERLERRPVPGRRDHRVRRHEPLALEHDARAREPLDPRDDPEGALTQRGDEACVEDRQRPLAPPAAEDGVAVAGQPVNVEAADERAPLQGRERVRDPWRQPVQAKRGDLVYITGVVKGKGGSNTRIKAFKTLASAPEPGPVLVEAADEIAA